MNAIIAEESVLRGWLAGLAAGLGAMTADAIFLVLAYLGAVRAVETVHELRDVMVGIGGILLLYFAYGAAHDATADWTEADVIESRGFWKALVLALTNPYQIVFWLTVGVGLLEPGTVDVLSYTPYVGDTLTNVVVVETGSPALILGFFAGIAIWVTGFPASLVLAGRRVDRFAPVVAYVSAILLAGFGVWFLVDAIGLVG
jgi:threonine/homoserine/homoserine lactone efflux protein